MTSYYPLEKIKGLENVKYIAPYTGKKWSYIRYLSVVPRTYDMKVKGLDNLFVGGEKSDLFLGTLMLGTTNCKAFTDFTNEHIS